MAAKLTYTQQEIRKLADKTPAEKRPEFKVATPPTHCIEYLSTGLGDTDCGGKPVRLSQHVSQCPACRAIYIFPAGPS